MQRLFFNPHRDYQQRWDFIKFLLMNGYAPDFVEQVSLMNDARPRELPGGERGAVAEPVTAGYDRAAQRQTRSLIEEFRQHRGYREPFNYFDIMTQRVLRYPGQPYRRLENWEFE